MHEIDPPAEGSQWDPPPCVLCGALVCDHTSDEQREEWERIEAITAAIRDLIRTSQGEAF